MANTIRLRRGSTTPTAGSFLEGEPAWDSTNSKLYIKNAAGTMVQINSSGGGSYTLSSSPPGSPVAGDRWTDSDDGITYEYINDGTSSQWVELGAIGVSASGGVFSSGSAVAPGLTVGSGVTYNPGLYSPGSDQLAVATAGVTRAQFDSAGLTLPGSTSGNITLAPTAIAGTTTLTLPATSGTLVTTGDTGSVTSTMLANGTIVDTDINASAAIAGTKVSPNFGAQLIQSSQANQALLLSGSLNPANTTQGLFSAGTLGFSGARMGGSFASSQTSYYQVVLQNTSSNAGASCDFVVCNDASTDTTNYGNFGINSSTFTGSGAFNAANATYVTSTSGPMVLGSTTAHDLRFVYNSETTDALTISASTATFGKTVNLAAGTATAAPLDFAAGTNLTAANAGTVEYDGTFFYATPTVTSGRGSIPALQTFRLTSPGANISTIADFYGATSAINMAAGGVYDLEFMAFLLKNTAGTITWTLTASSAPTLITATYTGSPVGGIAAGTPITGYAGSRAATTAAFNATASVTNNVYMAFFIKAQVIANLATTFKLQATAGTGSVTPQTGSFYTVRQVSNTVGSFA